MASTTKLQKDKTYGSTPRLVPRPTAASAARAARNATNRNLNAIPSQRQSPNRTASSPIPKAKRNSQKLECKSDDKLNSNVENEADQNDNLSQTQTQPEESSTNETASSNNQLENNSFPLQEIQEHHVFDIKPDIEEQPPTPVVQEDRNNQEVSRPQTPKQSSIPPTKSLPSSRPQTPRSRPTTPALQRHPSTPASRPTTPRPPTRPSTPHNHAHSPAYQTHTNHTNEDEDLRSVYISKQRQFNRMKMELDLKQQAILEVFDCLRSLRERMHREGVSGGGEGRLHELVVFNVGDWTSEEVSQMCKDAAKSSTEGALEVINNTMPIDEKLLEDLDTSVLNVPKRFADLCLKAFSARQELIDWVKELIETHRTGKDDRIMEYMQRISIYNSQGLQLCEALRELKCRSDEVVGAVTQLSRRTCYERSTLMSVGESLVREIAKLRQDLESRAAVINEMQGLRAETDTTKALEEARRELEEERAAKATAKEKLATAESQLRQMRIRISKMDRQLREAEASITSLTGTVKSLEDQSRQREVQLEARARKLKESLKTGEMTSGHLAQQRDALLNENAELKQQIEKLTAEHKSAIKELTDQLKETNASLEGLRKSYQEELELKQSLEKALQNSESTIEDLKAKVTELENSKPNPDLPTEREMDLWAELQATKDTLRITEDEVTACKREKVRFLETLTKIAESENKVGMQQKLAAELLSKEEMMSKMQIQIRELTKNIKLNEQKVIQYEQYVRDLQAHNRAVANCQESPNGISYQDLQQEIMTLKMNLLEAVHRNDELSEALLQKDQQLEQQDKTSRAQARVIKVREELINMLKNKETEQSRELSGLQQDLEHRMKIVDDVNKQIAAKAEEIQELFGTLENKQQQIHRLEKIVLALEEQQRRAQAQRIRHEEKIAALEHELAAGGNRRERFDTLQ